MILTLRKLTIIQKDDSNNSGNDTKVTLSSINDGADGSSLFGITNEHEDMSIEGGNTYTNKANPSIDIRALKPTGNAYTGQSSLQQLKDWSANKTDVYISGITLDGCVFMGDLTTTIGLVKIAINEQLSDNDVIALKITKKSIIGFSTNTGLHQNGFWAGNNLLGGYAWGDVSGSGIADGWLVQAGSTTTSFAGGVQTFIGGAGLGSGIQFYRDIYFPYEAETITVSVTIDAVTVVTAPKLRITLFDSSDSVIGSATNTDITTTGRISANTALTSDTFYARLAVVVAASDDVDFSDPMLSINGSTTYTKF